MELTSCHRVWVERVWKVLEGWKVKLQWAWQTWKKWWRISWWMSNCMETKLAEMEGTMAESQRRILQVCSPSKKISTCPSLAKIIQVHRLRSKRLETQLIFLERAERLDRRPRWKLLQPPRIVAWAASLRAARTIERLYSREAARLY